MLSLRNPKILFEKIIQIDLFIKFKLSNNICINNICNIYIITNYHIDLLNISSYCSYVNQFQDRQEFENK